MPFEKKAPFAIVGCHHPPKREGFKKEKHGIKLSCLSPTQYTTLYEPSWILLDVPCLPPVPEMHSCTDVQLPPLSYNTFTCSGDLWGVLACVGILPTTRHWNILEPPGAYTTLYEPSWILLHVPEMHSCTDVQLPPLSYNTFTCSGDLWGVLACVGILPTTRHWNILEPPGTYTTLYEPSWILLDVPCLPPVPEMHSCTDVQLPPLSYNTLSIDEIWRHVQNRGEVSMFKYFLLLPNGFASLLRKMKRNKLQRPS